MGIGNLRSSSKGPRPMKSGVPSLGLTPKINYTQNI